MFNKNQTTDPQPKKIDRAFGNKSFLATMGIHNIDDIFSRIHEKDDYQRTPLHRAVECEADNKLIKALLKHEADPNAQDDNGNTPLHYAAHNGDIECVELLLAHNANPHITNRYKKNALCDINASKAPHSLALYELLLKHQARGCFWEHDDFITEDTHKTLIQLAVKYYTPDHIEFDSQKNSLLHWATYHNLEAEVQTLVSAGCQLFTKNQDHKTAFMIAEERHLGTIQAILARAMKDSD